MHTCLARSVLFFIAVVPNLISSISRGEEAQTLVSDDDITITVLTTNTADVGAFDGITQGEWSFSAWVEVGGQAFLFDTGTEVDFKPAGRHATAALHWVALHRIRQRLYDTRDR